MNLKEEDLAMIAAQQYYIEHNTDLNNERLLNLLPNYIPDYCLTNAEKSIERWNILIIQAYKKVRNVYFVELNKNTKSYEALILIKFVIKLRLVSLI